MSGRTIIPTLPAFSNFGALSIDMEVHSFSLFTFLGSGTPLLQPCSIFRCLALLLPPHQRDQVVPLCLHLSRLAGERAKDDKA